MSMRRRICAPCLLALGLALAFSGCSHATRLPAIIADLRLTDAHRAMQGALLLGNGLRITLPPPARQGTQWVLLSNESRVLEQATPVEPNPDGGATVTFIAIHLGRSIVRFAALDPSQSESDPRDLFQVTVEVNEP